MTPHKSPPVPAKKNEKSREPMFRRHSRESWAGRRSASQGWPAKPPRQVGCLSPPRPRGHGTVAETLTEYVPARGTAHKAKSRLMVWSNRCGGREVWRPDRSAGTRAVLRPRHPEPHVEALTVRGVWPGLGMNGCAPCACPAGKHGCKDDRCSRSRCGWTTAGKIAGLVSGGGNDCTEAARSPRVSGDA